MSFRPGAPTSPTLPATAIVSSGTTTAAAALVSSDDEPPVDWDHQDPYAPRQPGLPLYTVSKDNAMSGSQDGKGTTSTGGGVEVVDSSTARRRPQGQSPAAFVDSATDPLLLDRRDRHHADDDDEKKIKEAGKDGKEVWPVSGIGMEGRIPETRRDFIAKGGGGTATRPRREVTWVSFSPCSGSSCSRAFPRRLWKTPRVLGFQTRRSC